MISVRAIPFLQDSLGNCAVRQAMQRHAADRAVVADPTPRPLLKHVAFLMATILLTLQMSHVQALVADVHKVKEAFTITRQEALRFSNFTYLLQHQDKCSGQDVHLLLFVKSAPENLDRRSAIRATWGDEKFIQRSKGVAVKVLFALGAPRGPGRQAMQMQEDLEREDRLHGDMIQQDFTDNFRNLTLKMVMQFHWSNKHCAHARYFMTADDDVLVHTPNLLDYLQDAPQTDLWVGHVADPHDGPIRDRESKYYLSPETYPWSTFLDYTYGSGYVVSMDVAEKIYQATLTLNASIHIDDVFIGICANVMGVKPRDHVFFGGAAKAADYPCIYKQMLTSHGHPARDMYEFWKKATDPQEKQKASETNCMLTKLLLLCKPYHDPYSYPCDAAFV